MSKLIWYCPKHPNVREFTTSAREHHTWVVDENGEFIRDIDCYDADADLDYAYCIECGEEAAFGEPPNALDKIVSEIGQSQEGGVENREP